MTERTELKGHLDLLLLSVLANGAAHGYGVIERLRTRTDGVLDFPEGTVYPALHKLEQQGLVASRWTKIAGRSRRMYALTRRGRTARQRRAGEWRTVTQAVDLVVGAS